MAAGCLISDIIKGSLTKGQDSSSEKPPTTVVNVKVKKHVSNKQT